MAFFLDFVSGLTKAAPKDEDSEEYPRERELLLRRINDLSDAVSEAQVSNDTAALRLYQEQARTYRQVQEQSADLLAGLTGGSEKMQIESMKARAADIRNIRDNYARMFSAYGQRGASIFNSVVNQLAAVPGISDTERRAAAERQLALMDPSDPATYAAWEKLSAANGGITTPEGRTAMANAASSYNAAKSALNSIGALEGKAAGSYTPADLEAVKSALNALNTGAVAPSLVAARVEVGEGSVPELQARLQALESRYDTTADRPSGKLRNPTSEELGQLAKSPAYQAWAKDRGFELGEFRDDGKYYPSRQELNAYWRSWREVSGKPTFGRDRLQEEMTIPTSKGARPYLFAVTKEGEDGSASEALMQAPNGALYTVNVATGDKVEVRDAQGRWQGAQYKLDYEPKLDSLASRIGAGGTLVTDKTVADLNSPDTTLGMDTGDLQMSLSTGRRIPVQPGDNPEKTLRLAQRAADGKTYEVVYTRTAPDQPWQEKERVAAPRYRYGDLPPERKEPEIAVNVQVPMPAPIAPGDKDMGKIPEGADSREAKPAPPMEEALPPAPRPNVSGPAPAALDQRGRPPGSLPPVKAAEPTGVPIPLPPASPPATGPIAAGLKTEPEAAALAEKMKGVTAERTGVVTGFGKDAEAARIALELEKAKRAAELTRGSK